MFNGTLDKTVFQDASWWHWAVTTPFIAAYLVGYEWAIGVVLALCVLAGGYFFARIGRLMPLPVQVRIAYFAWTAIGLLPGMGWMHWVQLFGTTAMVTVGYCPLLRILSLIPFNRNQPLSIAAVGYAFFRMPCAGGLVKWENTNESRVGMSCTLPVRAK